MGLGFPNTPTEALDARAQTMSVRCQAALEVAFGWKLGDVQGRVNVILVAGDPAERETG
jgi:hypothetical protein